MKKYCFTLFSVSDLEKVNEYYGWLTFDNISSFPLNKKVREDMNRSIVDTIYVYSQLLSSDIEYGWILSWNLYVTNNGIFSIDYVWNYIRLEENSALYIFRVGQISKIFYQFLKVFAKKTWNINVILPFPETCHAMLLSKIHSITHYDNPNQYIPIVIPAIDKSEDISYLANFITQSHLFGEKIIIKKEWFCWWNGIDILDKQDKDFTVKLETSIWIYLGKDFIIMNLLETTDIEYRVYWTKTWDKASVLEIHWKKRLAGQLLHNIAQWNELIRIDKNILPENLIADIEDYCSRLPELHWWLDVLTATDGSYYFTENNAMTGYLYEDVEKYFAKDWLDSIARCYR